MKCPHCGEELNAGAMLGSMRTDRKTAASKANGTKGGRPPKPTEGPVIRINPVNPPKPSDTCAHCFKPAIRKGWLNGVIVGLCVEHS